MAAQESRNEEAARARKFERVIVILAVIAVLFFLGIAALFWLAK